jgi:very-short-patch-repair endonuclease
MTELTMKTPTARSNSARTKAGQSKGKRKAAEICYRVSESFMCEAVTEYRFAAMAAGGVGKGIRARLQLLGLRDWRFDIAIPEHMIAVELDGGTWIQGRHSRGSGVISDMDKINAATVRGWRVLRYTHTNHSITQIISDISTLIHKQP